MQKTKTILSVALAISLISIAISVNESFAQKAPNTFISNVILIPDNTSTAATTQTVNTPMTTMVTLMPNIDGVSAGSSGSHGIDLLTPTANKRGQSPFMPVPSGKYDVSIVIPDGYTLSKAICKVQKPNGQWISIGTWDTENNVVIGVDLAAQKANKCTWKLDPTNT